MSTPRMESTHARAGVLLALAAAMLGCANKPETTAARTRVTPADFRSAAPPKAGAPAPTIPVAPPEMAAAAGVEVIVLTGSPGDESTPRTLTLGASDTPLPPLAASPAAPRSAPPPARQSGYLIDAFLGQVNGKPIYADEFLDPMDARLTAEARRLGPREWERFAASEIARALRDMLQDELLLAEFRASLSEQERVGIGAFIDQVRQGLISDSGGSREIARTRLEESEGLSLNEKVDDEVKRAFIREQIRREIADSVTVSFRDIEVYYDLHPEEFAPPPTAYFRIIQSPLTDTDRIARIDAAFGSGTPFEKIAEAETNFNRTNAGALERRLNTADLATAEILAIEPLNDAARKLRVGESTARIDANNAAWWIKLERLDRPAGQSLYEAQFEIEQKLKQQRYAEAERRYFQRIVGRAGFEDQQDVAIKLMEFATRRHRAQG